MADLLTHVLVPYVVLTVAGWGLTVSDRWIPVAMGGAAIPDLVKASLVLGTDAVSAVVGAPFSYAPISSIMGVGLIAGIVAVLFGDGDRRTAYAFLFFGGTTSLVLDGLRAFADGSAGYWLYPLWVRPPTPSLYVTSDTRVVVVSVAVALLVTLLDRAVLRTDESPA